MADLILQNFDPNSSKFDNSAFIAASSTSLTAPNVSFSGGDAGKYCYIDGAGPNGKRLQSKIASVTDATHVELQDAASTTVLSTAGRNFFCGSYQYQFFIKNREDFSFELNMPAIFEDLPEADGQSAIITKIEGNEARINVSFILQDYTGQLTSIVQNNSGTQVLGIVTPQQQFDFLTTTFQNTGISNAYRFCMDSSVTPTFGYIGVIDKLTISQSSDLADKYRCNLSFLIGNVITVTGGI